MSVHSKMTALADEIRELSGTTTTKSIDAMTSDVSAANDEVVEQADLIAQIKSAVDSLPNTGGGGVNKIPFLIKSSSDTYDLFEAEEGMTWEQFVNSSYKDNIVLHTATASSPFMFSITSSSQKYIETIPGGQYITTGDGFPAILATSVITSTVYYRNGMALV